MKRPLYFAVFILTLLMHLDTMQAQEFSLEWLAGTWQRIDEKPGRLSFEKWELNAGKLTGKGWTMTGQDTSFVEILALLPVDSDWFYEATVAHNEGAVRFKLEEQSEGYFVAENKKHDFPRFIRYQLLPGGSEMKVTIGDDQRSIDFKFVKTE